MIRRVERGRRAKVSQVEKRLLYLHARVSRGEGRGSEAELFLRFLRVMVPAWLHVPSAAPRANAMDRIRAFGAAEPAPSSAAAKALPWLWQQLRAAWKVPGPENRISWFILQYQSEVAAVRDWVVATRPNLSRFSWNEAAAASSAWHASLATGDKKSQLRHLRKLKLKPVQRVTGVPGWEGAFWVAGVDLKRQDMRAIGVILGHCYQESRVLGDYLHRGRLFFLFDATQTPKLALHAVPLHPDQPMPLRPETVMRVGEARISQDRTPDEARYGLLLYRSMPSLDWTLRPQLATHAPTLWPSRPVATTLGNLTDMAFGADLGIPVTARVRHHIDGDEGDLDNPAHHTAVGDVGYINHIQVRSASRRAAARRAGRDPNFWSLGVRWVKGGYGYYDFVLADRNNEAAQVMNLPAWLWTTQFRDIPQPPYGKDYVPSALKRR